MTSRSNQCFGARTAAASSLLLLLCLASNASAQSFKIGDTTYADSKLAGPIVAVGPGWVTIKVGAQSTPMQIVVNDAQLAELKKPFRQPTDPPTKTQVVVTGSADLSFLAKDQYINFTADLKAGKGIEEVNELTLFTPSETQSLGLMNTNGGEAPATGLPTGMFLVSGQVAAFGKGQLMVTVPTDKGRKMKVSVKVADSAKISVRMGDIGVAQVGDTVSAQGYIATRTGQPPQNTMLASAVEITLADTLMSKAKRRELAAADGPPKRTGRSSKEVEKQQPKSNDQPLAGIAGFEGAEKPKKPAKPDLKEMDKDEDSKAIARSDDPSPESLIITDTFVVDEAAAFDDIDEAPVKKEDSKD